MFLMVSLLGLLAGERTLEGSDCPGGQADEQDEREGEPEQDFKHVVSFRRGSLLHPLFFLRKGKKG